MALTLNPVAHAKRHHVGLAVVRAIVDDGPTPVIRVVQMDDLFRSERVLGTTTSPDIAATLIRDWLISVLDRNTPAAGGSESVKHT